MNLLKEIEKEQMAKLAAGKEQREIGLSIFGAEFQSGHGEMQTDDARRNGGASRARYSGRLVR